MQWDLGDFKIRPYEERDAESISENANNPKVAMNLRDSFPNPYTVEDARCWIEMCRDPTLGDTNWAIEVDGKAVGGIGLVIGQDVHRFSAEIGYWLGEPYWGKGIMTRAVGTITEYGLKDLGMIRIFTGVYERNPPSMRVLEKNGYVKEGVEKQSIFKGGVVMDAHVFAKLRD